MPRYDDCPPATLDALRRAYAQLVRLADVLDTDPDTDAGNRARLAAIEAECFRRAGKGDRRASAIAA